MHRYQETLGIAFAGLSGVVTPAEMSKIVRGVYTSKLGTPCVYPSFPRFSAEKPGRHNVMLWPFVSAFYADAAQQAGETKAFESELKNLARLAIEHGPNNFQEIYNLNGEPDGGWQRGRKWWLCPDQTWSATGYLRLFLLDVFGMQFSPEGLTLCPRGLTDSQQIDLKGIPYRNALLDISLKGHGQRIARCTIDGQEVPKAFIPATTTGRTKIEIELK